MRHYLKALIIAAVAFYLAYQLVPTIKLGSNYPNAFLIIAGIFLVAQIIHPLFSLVLLPVNFLTFGLVSLLLNVTLVFAFLNFLPGFNIGPYNFPGASLEGLILPSINFNRIATIILVAVVITFAQKILQLIFE